MVCRKATESEPAGVVTTTTLRQVLCFRKTVNEENLKLGYIKLFRSMQDNALWRKSVKKGVCEHSAWIDILLQVRWSDKPQQVIIGNHVLTCNRGESLNSLDTWASRWGWKSKKRVKTFLKTLQDADMIRIETVQISTRLTVVNFPSYQDYGNDLETERKRLGNAQGIQKKNVRMIRQLRLEEWKNYYHSRKELTALAKLAFRRFSRSLSELNLSRPNRNR